MPTHKRTYRSGKVVWRYQFNAPGSTKINRRVIEETGFSTKKEAADAEAERRVEEQKQFELAKATGKPSAVVLPKTFGSLLEAFITDYAEENLEPTTVENYEKKIAYLSSELLDLPIEQVSPLHLRREWARMLKAGGCHPKTKQPRPLSTKTVRNAASVVSKAFVQAKKWGLATTNPVDDSDAPVPVSREGVALMPQQTALMRNGAESPGAIWSQVPMIVEMTDAAGIRLGEVLAINWANVRDGGIWINQSVARTKKKGVFLKGTKNSKLRFVSLPDSTLTALEEHRGKQQKYRKAFGPDYCIDLDLVFAQSDGSLINPGSISARVSKVRQKVKLPKGASMHGLRHTHISQLIASGVDIVKVSKRAGHSSVAVTAKIYAHLLEAEDREPVRKWEEFQKRNQPLGWLPPESLKPQ